MASPTADLGLGLGLGAPVAVPCSSLPVVLPDDVITNIFARLPAKSVGRCRCLSRGWAATLSSDDFVGRHHRLANHDHGPKVFFLHHSGHGQMMHVWSQQDSPNGAPWPLHFPNPKSTNARKALRIATLECRGLAILQTPDAGTNYLCNPSTGQMAELPERQKMWWHRDDILGGHYASLGLGYDAHTKKHTAVRVYYRGSRCDGEGLPMSAGCDVYVINSTATGRRWRPVQDKPPAWVRPNSPSVSAQGHVYWLAERKINNIKIKPAAAEMVIVSFSVADHTFGTLEPAPGMESSPKQHLTKLGERLCFASKDVSDSCYDLWLRPEHGARVWDFHCRIDMSKVSPPSDRFLNWPNPLVTVDNGSRILLVRPPMLAQEEGINYSRLCAYEPATGGVEDIFSGSNMVYDWITSLMDAAVYVESVVSLGLRRIS